MLVFIGGCVSGTVIVFFVCNFMFNASIIVILFNFNFGYLLFEFINVQSIFSPNLDPYYLIFKDTFFDLTPPGV